MHKVYLILSILLVCVGIAATHIIASCTSTDIRTTAALWIVAAIVVGIGVAIIIDKTADF